MLCDLTVEGSGLSSTATNSVDLPAIPAAAGASTGQLQPDPDDSWAVYPANAVPSVGSADSVFTLPGGGRVVWKAHDAPRVNRDAELRFEVQERGRTPRGSRALHGHAEPRGGACATGPFFSHLHSAGIFPWRPRCFEAKKQRESGSSDESSMPAGNGPFQNGPFQNEPLEDGSPDGARGCARRSRGRDTAVPIPRSGTLPGLGSIQNRRPGADLGLRHHRGGSVGGMGKAKRQMAKALKTGKDQDGG